MYKKSIKYITDDDREAVLEAAISCLENSEVSPATQKNVRLTSNILIQYYYTRYNRVY